MEKKHVTAEEYLEVIESGKKAFLLDARTREDHAGWPVQWIREIKGDNIPYYDFMDHREEAMGKIPRDTPLYIICNRGNASDEIVDVLLEKGYDAHSIYTGMKAWGSLYKTGIIADQNQYKITQFNRIAKGCLSYIIESEGEAAIIDPGRHIDQYLDYLKEQNLNLKYIFDTHLHADHISGAIPLAGKTGARYILHDEDAATGNTGSETPGEKADYALGKHTIRLIAIHAPGHTPGSSFVFFEDRFLFTGDILFLSSMGRPDLGGQASKWVSDLWVTTRGLKEFDESVMILPAHHSGIKEFDSEGKVHATLGELRKKNPLLILDSKEKFEKEILSSLPEQPESYQTMRKTNLGIHHPDSEEMEELELGKNRCAVQSYQEGKKD